MLLLEGYISNFMCARYYFLYIEFSDLYVNQSLAGQTLPILPVNTYRAPRNVVATFTQSVARWHFRKAKFVQFCNI
jgi:hypothetical protein